MIKKIIELINKKLFKIINLYNQYNHLKYRRIVYFVKQLIGNSFTKKKEIKDLILNSHYKEKRILINNMKFKFNNYQQNFKD